MTLQQLLALGFDQSTKRGRVLSVRCSQCEALCINNVPCHETGCPNTPRHTEEEDP